MLPSLVTIMMNISKHRLNAKEDNGQWMLSICYRNTEVVVEKMEKYIEWPLFSETIIWGCLNFDFNTLVIINKCVFQSVNVMTV